MTNAGRNDGIALTEAQAEVSARLLVARQESTALARFPGALPVSLPDAYAIQSASIESWPDLVAGWKVGGVAASFRKLCGTDRVAGPIFAKSIIRARPKTVTTCAVFKGGYAAIEAEIVLQLGAAITPETEFSDDQMLIGAIKSAYIGAEIASSPVAAINQLGALAIVSDFGINFGLVVGAPIPDWASELREPITVTTFVDDVVAGQGVVDTVLAQPVAVLRFLVALCRERRISLAEGTFVSTGAITGVHEIAPGNNCRVEFSGFPPLETRFEYAKPRNQER